MAAATVGQNFFIALPTSNSAEQLAVFKASLKKWNDRVARQPPYRRVRLTTSPSLLVRKFIPETRVRLVELPNELMFEIATYLDPIDMLRLSQVSKSIRRCIFQQAQLPIWNVTIRADSKRPACPSFMNPVRYTGLLFGRTCFGCGSELEGMDDVVYELGQALCEVCYMRNVRDAADLRPRLEALLSRFPELRLKQECAPLIQDGLRSHKFLASSQDHGHAEDRCYYMPEFDFYLAHYLPMVADIYRKGLGDDAARIAINARLDYVRKWDKFAKEATSWRRGQEGSKGTLTDIRESEIITRLKAQGVEEFSWPQYPYNKQWLELVRRDEPLTPTSWETLLPQLLRLIDDEENRRIEEEEEDRVNKRLKALVDEYQELLPARFPDAATQDLMPNRAHARGLQFLISLAESDLHDDEDCHELRECLRQHPEDMFAQAVAESRRIQDRLWAMLDAFLSEHHSNACSEPADRGALAVSLFRCNLHSEDQLVLLTLDQVCSHWRTAHSEFILHLGETQEDMDVDEDQGGVRDSPASLRERKLGVEPYLEGSRYLREMPGFPFDIDSARLESLDQLVQAGMISCPCRISLHDTYQTWRELLVHCQREVRWTAAMLLQRSDCLPETIPDDHRPGCLAFTLDQTTIQTYVPPAPDTLMRIEARLDFSSQEIHCGLCRRAFRLRCEEHRRVYASIEHLPTRLPRESFRIAHHFRAKHGLVDFEDDYVVLSR